MLFLLMLDSCHTRAEGLILCCLLFSVHIMDHYFSDKLSSLVGGSLFPFKYCGMRSQWISLTKAQCTTGRNSSDFFNKNSVQQEETVLSGVRMLVWNFLSHYFGLGK